MEKEIGHYWYANWFNTPFYHILYKDRDHTEAENFMDHLTAFLKLPTDAEILDLACGKGRHSIYLNKLGFNVVGADLSESSIAYAKQFENETLHFLVHDMSQPIERKFDAIFNLFTSFGYFEREADNLHTIQAIKGGLKENGYGVIDFLNVEYVMKNLIPDETKVIDGITFHIKKYLQDGHIMKDIRFSYDGTEYTFTEKVRALTLDHFKDYFDKANVTLHYCLGDYEMNKFDAETSDRLILIFN